MLKRFFNNYAPSKTVASSTDVVGFKKNRQSGGMMGRGLIMLNRTLTLMLAFAAGSLGGTLLRNVVPTGAFAQTQSTAPKEIRAQRFTLVDENGRMRGVFAIEPPSSPNGLKQRAGGDAVISLYDDGGREVFRAGAPSGRLVGQ